MPDITTDLHFPKAGIDRSQPFGRQPNRAVANGEYARTTPIAINVRGFEPGSNRTRGGQRSGLRKYVPAQVSGTDYVIQHLNVITTRQGGSVQTSQSGRVVSLVVVVAGNVYYVNPGDTTWTSATNATSPLATPPLNITGLVRSAANGQKLWFADGINWIYYDPSDNTVRNWVATAGTLPVDEDGNLPTLIENWRGRIVLSGLPKDPQNIFMSRVDNPRDFDYFPLSPGGPSDAIAGNVTNSYGLIGDVVTCLIPYNDDTLVVGCDASIHILRGDPGAGGQVDLVTRAIGMAFGLPWCVDPTGTIYFFSNRTGIFSMVPGQPPQRISDPIQQTLQQIDTGKYGVCMGWDDRFQGLHVFVTLLAEPAPTTHYYYDQRNQAWFHDEFEDDDMNPLVCTVFDGNLPTDRVLLIGSWDGYVRAIDPDAETDDGTDIDSEVWIGPLLSKNLDDVMLKALQAVLGSGSGELTYSIHAGATAEIALASEAVDSGVWSPDRNLSSQVRVADHSIYVKLTASNPWAMESIRAITSIHGKIRSRGR